MATKKSRPKILFYDIETSLLKAYLFSLGEQRIRHGQLVPGFDVPNIICISYAWEGDKTAKSLVFDYQKQDCKKLVQEFDKIIKQADITIGKNSDRFDVKHINTQRLIHGLDPMPEWVDCTDDVEKQLRKYFYLPSYSLDYVSKLFGLGGKDKMDFADWVHILEKTPSLGEKALAKMVKYNRKDVMDTLKVWEKISAHVKPKFNQATFLGTDACRTCGSTNITRNGTRVRGKVIYQKFFCRAHGGHAGEAPLTAKGKEGKIG